MSAAVDASSSIAPLITKGRFREADQLVAQALTAAAGAALNASPQVIKAHLDAVYMDWLMGRWKSAQQRLANIELALKKHPLPANDEQWLVLQRLQIGVYADVGELGRADRAFEQGTAKAREQKLEQTPAYVNMLEGYAQVLGAQQRDWDAIQVRQRQLDWLLANEPKNTLKQGLVLTAIGQLHSRFGRDDAAGDAFIKAEPLLESQYRAKTPAARAAVDAMARWAFAAVSVHNYEKWSDCTLREEWLRAIEAELGADSAMLIEPLTEAASYCEEEIRASTRVAMFERALKLSSDHLGERHPDRLYALHHQGVYYASREYSELQQSKGWSILASLEKLEKQVYSYTPAPRLLSRLYHMVNELPESCTSFATGACKKQLEALLTPLSAAWGQDHPSFLILQAYVADNLGSFSSSGATDRDNLLRREYATGMCNRAVERARQRLGDAHPQNARMALTCAGLYSYNEAAKSIGLFRYAAGVLEKQFGKTDSLTQEAARQAERMQSILDHQAKQKGSE